MTESEMHELFERHGDAEHMDFADIPESERLHPDELICGLLKAYSLAKKQDGWRYGGGASHGTFHVPDIDPEKTTEADIVYLIRCGVFWSDEYDGLIKFV